MERRIIKNDRIRGEYIEVKHPSGLTVLMYPMKGYSNATALFGTKYGSIDTTFKTKNDDDYVTVPEGIAHYLEHKLFENEDSPVFEQFGKTGAYCNAATSFEQTFYFFRCSDKFEENLNILLKFVQSPYFTKENVDKEQGIIAQEIRMYEDVANWRVFFNLLIACYSSHPVRIDIAGTVESISHIDAPLLYRCYNTFYNLSNMVLCVAGNFDVDTVLECCNKLLKPSEDLALDAKTAQEPYTVNMHETVQQLSVAMPLFHIGFKGKPLSGIEEVKSNLEHSIMLELVLGRTSSFYKKLYDEGLINASFGSEVFSVRGAFLSIVAGESRNPREVLARIKAEVNRLKSEKIDELEFEVLRKGIYGDSIRELSNVDSVAQSLMNAQFNGLSSFDTIDCIAALKVADIKRCLDEFDVDNCSISIIEPKTSK